MNNNTRTAYRIAGRVERSTGGSTRGSSRRQVVARRERRIARLGSLFHLLRPQVGSKWMIGNASGVGGRCHRVLRYDASLPNAIS
jgi:hypothetical protein